ncbi:sulfotransferase domain-containing protein [Paraglaciecola aestuariivivens]
MSNNSLLITGIPRSGTTLCCKLLNQHQHVVALHEPIDPANLAENCLASLAVEQIAQQIAELDHAIENGLPFTHGDKGGLTIENPVGLQTSQGVRQVVAARGKIQLPARQAGSYQLVVKQNALFTALLTELSAQFKMLCIVRNPVDVLLSWLTVDLPVNSGHIPAGERFDPKLKAALAEPDCLTRQLIIYQWFMQRFLASGLPIIKYEDVIASGGAVLDKALDLQPMARETLSKQERHFDTKVLHTLGEATDRLVKLDCSALYSQADIKQALDAVGV